MVSTSFFAVALLASIAFVSASPVLFPGGLAHVNAGYIGTEDIILQDIAEQAGQINDLEVTDNLNDARVGK